MIEFENVNYRSLRQLALTKKVNYSTFKGRIKKGWTIEEALGLKNKVTVRLDYRPITVGGIYYPSISKAAKEHNIDPDLCRDRLDLGWSIEKVFGKNECTSKGKVEKGPVDAEYISIPRDMTNRSLIRNTEPFFFGRHIYPSMYLMLMSCEGVTKKQALRGSQSLSKQRRKHFTKQCNIGFLADKFGLEKPAYLSGLQRFIYTLSKSIDLTDCFYDGTLTMHKRLLDNGFCRQRYLSFYNLTDQLGLEPIIENSLYRQSTFCDKSLVEVNSKVACDLLNITDGNLRKRRERIVVKEEVTSVNQGNAAVIFASIKQKSVASRIRKLAEFT